MAARLIQRSIVGQFILWLSIKYAPILLMLKGELEETMAELEESRRKLVSLKMQKDIASGTHSLVPAAAMVNGSVSPEKRPADGRMDLQELKDSVEEAKVSVMDNYL